MADDASRTATTPSSQDRVCKACNRIMASISPEGNLLPLGTQDEACDICRPFEQLYTVMQTKDEAFSALKSRRFEHLPRYQALEESKAAHRTFDNFLMQVEAQLKPRADGSKRGIPKSTIESTPASMANEEHDRSPPQTEEVGMPHNDLLLPSVCPVKRRRPLLNGERSVSFDSAVVFHEKENGRPDEAFSRNSKVYVPGRNAPMEGREYLDTSGLSTTATRFFGVKRHKKGWVETKEGRELDKEWANEENQNETDVRDMDRLLLQDEVDGGFEKKDTILSPKLVLNSGQERHLRGRPRKECKSSTRSAPRDHSRQNEIRSED